MNMASEKKVTFMSDKVSMSFSDNKDTYLGCSLSVMFSKQRWMQMQNESLFTKDVKT